LCFRCKEDYLKKDDWVINEETLPRMCGFTMFIGELFLNFEVFALLLVSIFVVNTWFERRVVIIFYIKRNNIEKNICWLIVIFLSNLFT